MTNLNCVLTEQVHNILQSRLNDARAKMDGLKKQQNDIDLQIEDTARVVLSLERAVATLAAAIPRPEDIQKESSPDVNSLMEQMRKIAEGEYRENEHHDGPVHYGPNHEVPAYERATE